MATHRKVIENSEANQDPSIRTEGKPKISDGYHCYYCKEQFENEEEVKEHKCKESYYDIIKGRQQCLDE